MQVAKKLIRDSLSHLYCEQEIESISKLIFEKVLGFSRLQVHLNQHETISSANLTQITEIVNRLIQFEPIQYILGETEFYGLPLKVNPAVLIPRPETEELVDWIIHDCSRINPIILDIGTGSGCIPIVIKKNKPAWNIFAVDISENALEVANVNALKHHTVIEFFQMDILTNTHFSVDKELYEETNDKIPFRSDIIVSNPPYIPLKEKALMSASTIQFEPHLALFVDDKHPIVFYEKIADFALIHLKENGKLYVELNEFNANDVYEMMIQKGFKDIIIKKDFAGKDRMLRTIL